MIFLIVAGVVHEHPRIGSDGESEEGSRTSEDVVSPANRGSSVVSSQTDGGLSGVAGSTPTSTTGGGTSGIPGGAGPNLTTVNGNYGGVKMRQKAGGPRRLTSQEEINKRLSLPADLKLPDNFVEKQAVSPTLEGPLTRATRRQSLSEIGFGRMDTYTKLDKLGEVIKDSQTRHLKIGFLQDISLCQKVHILSKNSSFSNLNIVFCFLADFKKWREIQISRFF